MSSLEIAEITGKEHKNVMQSIRSMEPAWGKIAGLKFQLGSYQDANNQSRPCYSLTKTECLYIATKFNDEARAKLVLRWEELEQERMARMQRQAGSSDMTIRMENMISRAEQLIVTISEKYQISLTTITELQPKADYTVKVLAAENCLLTSVIAKDLGMSARTLNVILHKKGVQYKQGHTWLLYAPFQDKGLADMRTYQIDDTHCREHLVWTERGRAFIIDIVENGIPPKEALKRTTRLSQPLPPSLMVNISVNQ